MSASSEIAEKIQAARREAEELKERIKQNRDAMNDTTCMFMVVFYVCI